MQVEAPIHMVAVLHGPRSEVVVETAQDGVDHRVGADKLHAEMQILDRRYRCNYRTQIGNDLAGCGGPHVLSWAGNFREREPIRAVTHRSDPKSPQFDFYLVNDAVPQRVSRVPR